MEAMYNPENVQKRYKQYMEKLANIHAEIRDMNDDFKEVSNFHLDAGDLDFDAERVLIDLGALLADLIVYANSYEMKESSK